MCLDSHDLFVLITLPGSYPCSFRKLLSHQQFIVASASIFKQSMTGVMSHPGLRIGGTTVKPMWGTNGSTIFSMSSSFLKIFSSQNWLKEAFYTILGPTAMISCNIFLNLIYLTPKKDWPKSAGGALRCKAHAAVRGPAVESHPPIAEILPKGGCAMGDTSEGLMVSGSETGMSGISWGILMKRL